MIVFTADMNCANSANNWTRSPLTRYLTHRQQDDPRAVPRNPRSASGAAAENAAVLSARAPPLRPRRVVKRERTRGACERLPPCPRERGAHGGGHRRAAVRRRSKGGSARERAGGAARAGETSAAWAPQQPPQRGWCARRLEGRRRNGGGGPARFNRRRRRSQRSCRSGGGGAASRRIGSDARNEREARGERCAPAWRRIEREAPASSTRTRERGGARRSDERGGGSCARARSVNIVERKHRRR